MPEMNPEIQQSPKKDGWLGRVLKVIINNWTWKLLALFLAICLWVGLITQDPTLTRERVFTDATVSITGAETLRRNGLIVLSGLEDEVLHARLRVEVPQREYNTVGASNYNPRVELSRITSPARSRSSFTPPPPPPTAPWRISPPPRWMLWWMNM